MVRGIEKWEVFWSDHDRLDLLGHIAALAPETETAIYAWSLMPNHFHLLLRSGPAGLSTFMRRLQTGYAGAFNRRHKRTGHLFQNRFKSILIEEDAYCLELVRYLHLNPLRAGLARSLWGSSGRQPTRVQPDGCPSKRSESGAQRKTRRGESWRDNLITQQRPVSCSPGSGSAWLPPLPLRTRRA